MVEGRERPAMDQRTHEQTSEQYVGRPAELGDGHAVVELETSEEMAVDDSGLVHGGFVYGAADYAAMLAVNEPTVVLAASEVRYPHPTRVGQTVRAEAAVEDDGDRPAVEVTAAVGGETVLEGTFRCAVLDEHPLG
jgi:acyl-coenzyme A thioesterase PaaI-like protein